MSDIKSENYKQLLKMKEVLNEIYELSSVEDDYEHTLHAMKQIQKKCETLSDYIR